MPVWMSGNPVCSVVICAVVVEGNCEVSLETTPCSRNRFKNGYCSAYFSINSQPKPSTRNRTTLSTEVGKSPKTSAGSPDGVDPVSKCWIIAGYWAKL